MIYEFVCVKCREVYIGEDENDTEHAQRSDGIDCFGLGELRAVYAPTVTPLPTIKRNRSTTTK